MPPPWIVKVPVSFQVVTVPTTVVLKLSIVKVLPLVMVVEALAECIKPRIPRGQRVRRQVPKTVRRAGRTGRARAGQVGLLTFMLGAVTMALPAE